MMAINTGLNIAPDSKLAQLISELCAERDAAIARAEAAEEELVALRLRATDEGWQPIRGMEPPQDGQRAQLREVMEATWDAKRQLWHLEDGDWDNTEWRPLPAPPDGGE